MNKSQKIKKTEPEPALGRYTTIIASGDNWFVARCVELDLMCQGRTEAEARARLEDAVEIYLESAHDDELAG